LATLADRAIQMIPPDFEGQYFQHTKPNLGNSKAKHNWSLGHRLCYTPGTLITKNFNYRFEKLQLLHAFYM
jgi:hypothetical protein